LVDAVFPAPANPSSVTERVERAPAKSNTPVVIAVLGVGLLLVLTVLGVGLYIKGSHGADDTVSAQPITATPPAAPQVPVDPSAPVQAQDGVAPPTDDDPLAGWGAQDDGAPSVEDDYVDDGAGGGGDGTQHHGSGHRHHGSHDPAQAGATAQQTQ